jgi:hypothetical protein
MCFIKLINNVSKLTKKRIVCIIQVSYEFPALFCDCLTFCYFIWNLKGNLNSNFNITGIDPINKI